MLRGDDEYMALKSLYSAGLRQLRTILSHLSNDADVRYYNKYIANNTDLSIHFRKCRTINLIVTHLKTDYLTLYYDYFAEHNKIDEIKWIKKYEVGEIVLIQNVKETFSYTHLSERKYVTSLIRNGIILKFNQKSIKIGLYHYTSEHYTERIFINYSFRVLHYYRLIWNKEIDLVMTFKNDNNIIKFNDNRYFRFGRYYFNDSFIVGQYN